MKPDKDAFYPVLLWILLTLIMLGVSLPPYLSHRNELRHAQALSDQEPWQALTYLQKALALQPHNYNLHDTYISDIKTLMDHAPTTEQQQQLKTKLKAELDRAHRQNPYHVNMAFEVLQYHLSEWLEHKDQAELAVVTSMLPQILAMDPYNPYLQEHSGRIYLLLGLPSQAETCYKNAVDIKPRYPDFYRTLIRFYFAQNRQVDIDTLANNFQHEMSDYVPAASRDMEILSDELLAQKAVADGDHARAYAYYAQALAIKPEGVDDWYNTAACRVNLKDYLGAQKMLSELLQKFPDYAQARVLKAKLDQALGAGR